MCNIPDAEVRLRSANAAWVRFAQVAEERRLEMRRLRDERDTLLAILRDPNKTLFIQHVKGCKWIEEMICSCDYDSRWNRLSRALDRQTVEDG